MPALMRSSSSEISSDPVSNLPKELHPLRVSRSTARKAIALPLFPVEFRSKLSTTESYVLPTGVLMLKLE
jgi:hypothetical protein